MRRKLNQKLYNDRKNVSATTAIPGGPLETEGDIDVIGIAVDSLWRSRTAHVYRPDVNQPVSDKMDIIGTRER